MRCRCRSLLRDLLQSSQRRSPNEYHHLAVHVAKPGLTARTIRGYHPTRGTLDYNLLNRLYHQPDGARQPEPVVDQCSLLAIFAGSARLKQAAQILRFGVRSGAKQRLDEDFLRCFQRGAMLVVNAITASLLASALGKWGKHEQANRAIVESPVVFGVVPDDEQGTTLLVFV